MFNFVIIMDRECEFKESIVICADADIQRHTHSAFTVTSMSHISHNSRVEKKNKIQNIVPRLPPYAHIHPQLNMIHILTFTPPPDLTHEPLISIIINICLFNFQLCHNVSA